MNKITTHINKLILKHNCVIVPNLGGFITQNVPAKFEDKTNTFYPPMRSIGFNPQLTFNDGLLVQSYMQTYDLDYPESVHEIENSVKEIQNTLNNSGMYDFTGIGKLSRNQEGKLIFAAAKSDVCSPEFYGLKSFSTTTVEGKVKNKATYSNATATKRNYTFSVNRELVNYVTAAVFALVFYFVWATPLSNDSGTFNMNQASVLSRSMFNNAAPVNNTKEVSAKKADAEANTQSCWEMLANKQQEISEAAETQKVQEAVVEKGFTIVLASAIPEENAEIFLENLKEKGFDEGKIFHDKHMLRVIYGSYENANQAYTALSECKKEGAFRQAWVMELK